MSEHVEKPRRRVLIAGVFLGAVVAAAGLVRCDDTSLAGNVVASVGGEAIPFAQYQSALQGVQGESEKPLPPTQQLDVLQSMIDERLLVRHAVESGLIQSDVAVRKVIIDAAVDNIISANKGVEPDEAQLADFYKDNGRYFREPSLVALERMVFRGIGALERADEAHVQLSNKVAFAVVKATLASPDIYELPAELLPASRLAGYLGPTIAHSSLLLSVGEFSDPQPTEGGYVIVRVLEERVAKTPPLSAVREPVLREYKRRANDILLQDYVRELRASSEIVINESLFDGASAD